MDLQDHTTPSGHGVHLCRRCGWPFPNPHPSAKHRRSHKKICGTIQGYTNLIAGSEVVSDDEHEKTPSPKIKKNRSEDDMFSDAVTEFSDSAGSVNKSLDKDVFFSFKDAENDGTNEVVNAPIEINKVDASLEVSGKQDTHVEKSQETEITTICDSSKSKSKSKLELADTDAEPADDLVKDGVLEPVSQSQEADSIQVVEAGVGESQTSETISEEAKDSDIIKMTPEVFKTVGDNIKLENIETAKADAISEEIKQEMNADCEPVSEVVKDSETVEGVEGINEEIKHGKIESEIDQNVSILIKKDDLQEQGQECLTEKVELGAEEVIEEPDTVVTEKEDIKEPILEKGSIEQVHEVENPDSILTEKENLVAPGLEIWSEEKIPQVVEEPDTVLTEKEDVKEPILEKGSNEQVLEVEKPDSTVTEKENLELEKCSEEQIQDVVKEPETVLIVKENLGELNEPTHEVVEKPDSGLTQKQDLDVPAILEKCSEESQPDSDLIENEDLGALKSEKLKVDDVSVENSKNASGVIPVEEGNEKVLNNQDCGPAFSVDSSSRNSLDANWGSVSVLSAASVDAETLEKSKASSLKSSAADSQSDVYEAPSFMTLVKPEVKDQKPGPQQQPNSESSEAGWFPTLTKVNNESEGRKRNEEVIAKVTNWGTGTSLKNLLGEAKSPPSGKQTEVEKDKDEGANGQTPHEVSSPPKLIEDGKKGKKVKGRSSWVPFVCCSSVNVVN